MRTLDQLSLRLRRKLVDQLAASSSITERHPNLDELVRSQCLLDLFDYERREAAGTDVDGRSEVMTEHAKEVDLLAVESHLSPVFYRLGAELK